MKSRDREIRTKGFMEATDGTLVYEGRLSLPKDKSLRRALLEEAHNMLYPVHPGGTICTII